MKKILIVHNHYQIAGGEDTVVFNEKKLLEDYGHEVSLYTRSNTEINSWSKIKKIFLPFIMFFNFKTYFDIKRKIKNEKIDILHVHNTLFLISPAVYYAGIKCHIPVVQTVHNFRLLCPGATFYRDGHICEDCVKHGLRCAVKHGCYRGSRLQTLICVISSWIYRVLGIYRKISYICLSEFNKEKLLNLKQIKPSHVYVKPNFTYKNNILREKGEYYLFIGRIEKIKGINILIDAFEKCPERRLIIVGTGTEEEYYKKTVSQRSISNIKFVGYKNREEVNSLLSGAKALIVTSQWYETFGMTVIEAYSSGVPVICGNIGNVADLIKENVTGMLFEYSSSDSLNNVLEKFETEDKKNWMTSVEMEYETMYSPEMNIYMLEAIYEKLGGVKHNFITTQRFGYKANIYYAARNEVAA